MIAPNSSRPLIVTGMHRSGTSLTMRMLGALGVDLGTPQTFFAPDAYDNPDGYQEHVPVVELDDRLLRVLGGHASEPPKLTPGWESGPEVELLADEASALLDELFEREPWAVKDPRASLLLPFWRKVRPDLRVIVCVRNPLEVAVSMQRRGDDYSLAHWLSSWVAHTSAALSASDPADRTIVLYEDLLSSTRTVADELAIFVTGSPMELELLEDVAGVVDPAMRRSQATDLDLEMHPGVPRPVARYYFAVRDLARAQARSRIAASVR